MHLDEMPPVLVSDPQRRAPLAHLDGQVHEFVVQRTAAAAGHGREPGPEGHGLMQEHSFLGHVVMLPEVHLGPWTVRLDRGQGHVE